MHPASPRNLLAVLLLLASTTVSRVALPAAASGAATVAAASPAQPDDAALAQQLDALLQPIFPGDQPGAAVLVARNGKPIYRRGFGLADIERNVPVQPDMVFRIGSVTKQFTSALVMQLVEQGRIGLQDDITKYLPDYPTQGKTITIENLLTHTSGVTDYTNLPDWQGHMTEAMTHQQVIDLIKDKPLNFEPGEQWAYSNSGYFLLGVIIEKVTGRSYADVLSSEILRPLGMKRSGYGKDDPSFPGEVHGYQRTGDEVQPAAPLSMTSPYAAGAIVSSVDDLLRWDNGLNSGKVLQEESLRRVFTPYTLKNGRPTGYGYGWAVSSYAGHRVQEHNGGINGFLSHVTRLPDDRLYVAMLTNTESPVVDVDYLALEIVGIAVGRPLPQPGAFKMPPEKLDEFVGVYRRDSTTTRIISREGDKIFTQRAGGSRLEIFPTDDSTFAYVGRPAKLTFGRDQAGKLERVTLDQSGITETYRRTDAPIPAAPRAITLDSKQLDACVGQYELAPTFRITVTRDGTSLMVQATGQPKFAIFPTSATLFFLEDVDAQIEFQPGPDGKMTSLILHQAGLHTQGKRVD